MSYLLDTDVLINHLRGKDILQERVIKFGAYISIITQAELYYGAYKSGKKQKGVDEIEYNLGLLKIRLINLDTNILFNFANIKADLEKQGRRLEDFDLLIAATAITHGLTLISKNTKHFERIKGLKLL